MSADDRIRGNWKYGFVLYIYRVTGMNNLPSQHPQNIVHLSKREVQFPLFN